MAKGKKQARKQNIVSTQMFLPILEIRGDIIVTKNRHYYKMLEFSPINFDLRSGAEQADIISRFSAVIRSWPKDVHIKVVTSPSNVSKFIHGLSECYEAEESESCRILQMDQMQMLESISEQQGVTRRFFVSFGYDEEGGFKLSPRFEEIKNDLDYQAMILSDSMASCGNTRISPTRASIGIDSRDYILEVLYSTICKAQSDSLPWEIRKDAVLKNYENTYGKDFDHARIPAADFIAMDQIESAISPRYLIVDGVYVMHCFVPTTGYPTHVFGGWLEQLFGHMPDINVDFWVHKEKPEVIQRKLAFELKNATIKQRNTETIASDYEEIEATLQAGYDIKRAISSGDDFCYISTIVTIYGNSAEDLEMRYKAMREWCIRADMDLKVCMFQQDEAFLSCIPYAPFNKGIFDKSKRNVMASQLGSCYPFTAYELSDEGGIFMGLNSRNGSPVFLNPFNRIKYENANMMILGTTGSGKTYTLLCMLLRMRQMGIPVYAIAPIKGREFLRACTAIGGEFVELSPGSAQNINVLEIRKQDTKNADLIDGRSDTAKGSILVAKITQLHSFFSLIFKDMTPIEQQVLDEALVETYKKYGITHRNKSLIDPQNPNEYKRMPLLGDLHAELNRKDKDGKQVYGEEGKKLALLLSRFVTGSARSFNQPTNVDLSKKFVVFNLDKLTDELLPLGMFIALDFLFDKIQEDISTNKVVAIDELWLMMKASPLSAQFAEKVFRTIRGYGGSAIGATQDLSGLMANNGGSGLIENSNFQVLLPLQRGEVETISTTISLTEAEKEIITKKGTTATAVGQKKRANNALLIASANHVVMQIKASDTEHRLITTNTDELAQYAREASEHLLQEAAK